MKRTRLLLLLLAPCFVTLLLSAPLRPQESKAGYARQYLRYVYSVLHKNFLYPVHEDAVLRSAIREMKRVAPGLKSGGDTWAGLDEAFDSAVAQDPSSVSPVGEAAIRGMVNGLGDPYSSFLNARELALVKGQLAGESFTGIGVELAPSKSGLMIVAALEGGPALKAGLRCRDVIASVDGTPVKGRAFDDAANLLLGREGTAVRLKILRGGKACALSLKRAKLRIPPAFLKMLDGATGYLKISIFSRNVYEEVRSALGGAAGMRRLVVDLRNNPGGEFEAALRVSSLFVAKAVLVRVRSRGLPDKVHASPCAQALSVPLVLLVNGGTASSSEVVTCALKDNRRARVVGTKTFGKGLIQSYYPLVGGTAIKLTTGKYLSPSGADIHGRGIAPDVPLPENAGDKAYLDSARKALGE